MAKIKVQNTEITIINHDDKAVSYTHLKTETFGREQLLDFMKYIENEYTYYVKYTDFYSKFEIYRQTMRPSSKNSACSGGSRLKAFL